MKILMSSEFMKISLDDSSPILSCYHFKLPQSSNGINETCHSICDALDEYPETFKPVYVICDCSALQPFSFDLLVSYYISSITQLQKKGIAFTAFIIPANFYKVLDVGQLLKKTEQLPVAYFDEYNQALQFVKNEWHMASTKIVA